METELFKKAERLHSKINNLKYRKRDIEKIINLSETDEIKIFSNKYKEDIDIEVYTEYSVTIPISKMNKILKILLDEELLNLTEDIEQKEYEFETLI